jgi:hypothetical protein
MQIRSFLAAGAVATFLVGCGGGDINISPSNVDNSVDNSTSGGSGGSGASICASYEKDGATQSGTVNGANCVYSPAFVDYNNPLTVDLTIPNIGDGAHIFQGSLWVGENYDSDADLATAGITEGGDGPTLTISAGVTIAHQTSADFMVVNRGSQIVAEGTSSAPITFTSASDVLGTIDPEAISQWGGMVINGFGVTNKCSYTGTYGVDLALDGECHVPSEGSEGDQANNYGGINDADSSGSLEYVIVKHTGAQVANGDELNGITMGAVGSGTNVSHVEVYSVYDDGIEFFGGAVNVDHYLALYVNDDAIDIDEGYRGTVEFALVIQSETNGNRCIEADGVGSYDAAKAASDIAQGLNSQPTIRNLTCIVSPTELFDAVDSPAGTGTHDPGQGWRLREGLYPTIQNALVTSAFLPEGKLGDTDHNYCFRLTDAETENGVASGDVVVEGSIFACQDLTDGGDVLDQAAQLAFLDTDNLTCQTAETGEDPSTATANGLELLNGYYALEIADMLIPGVADVSAAIAPVGGATYIGGMTEADDWAAGWTYGLDPANRGQDIYLGDPL